MSIYVFICGVVSFHTPRHGSNLVKMSGNFLIEVMNSLDDVPLIEAYKAYKRIRNLFKTFVCSSRVWYLTFFLSMVSNLTV